ncbi:MAG TPA: PEGA domain-containing protein, partial [Gammaproteobacteria bacterium]|nr:PEGA domain-containing protein [Gammaproteobacteria bacterium]
MAVQTQPVGAVVSVDGKVVGKSPPEREVDAGVHEVRAVLEGYLPQSGKASVSPAAVEVVDLQLTKIITHGTAKISTTPDGGAIRLI